MKVFISSLISALTVFANPPDITVPPNQVPNEKYLQYAKAGHRCKYYGNTGISDCLPDLDCVPFAEKFEAWITSNPDYRCIKLWKRAKNGESCKQFHSSGLADDCERDLVCTRFEKWKWVFIKSSKWKCTSPLDWDALEKSHRNEFIRPKGPKCANGYTCVPALSTGGLVGTCVASDQKRQVGELCNPSGITASDGICDDGLKCITVTLSTTSNNWNSDSFGCSGWNDYGSSHDFGSTYNSGFCSWD